MKGTACCGQRRSQEMDLSGLKEENSLLQSHGCHHSPWMPPSSKTPHCSSRPSPPLHQLWEEMVQTSKPWVEINWHTVTFPDGQPDWQVQQVQSQPCLQNTQTLSPMPPQTTDTISFLQFWGKRLNPPSPFLLYQFWVSLNGLNIAQCARTNTCGALPLSLCLYCCCCFVIADSSQTEALGHRASKVCLFWTSEIILREQTKFSVSLDTYLGTKSWKSTIIRDIYISAFHF